MRETHPGTTDVRGSANTSNGANSLNGLTIDLRDEPRPYSSVRTITVTGPQALDLAQIVDALREAMVGGPPLLPVPHGQPGADVLEAGRGGGESLAPGTVLLLPTSGSTGRPKVVELSGHALMASASATHQRIGKAGRWLLALPLTHIAGWQVLVRGLLAEEDATLLPARVDPDAPFGPESFCAAMQDDVQFTSLVPTQLSRLLEHRESSNALSRMRAVLVGGAATPERLSQRAAYAGITIVRTYGSTETSGGCLYDGEPLDDVQVSLSRAGLLRVSGPMLATRYRGPAELTDEAFVTDDTGRRWYLPADQASIDSDDRVSIRGRADDTIVTGGENVSPASVETVLLSMHRIRDAIVVGLPHPEWGQQVAAVVSLNPRDVPAGDVADLATGLVEQRLGRHCAPKVFVIVDDVPSLGIGKPDRKAAYRVAVQAAGEDDDEGEAS